ncbi:MAG TPA: plastocyanin [Pseudolabrys sp.]|nr:plastocyanin [Pseudolabrys sp.]
MKGYLMRLGRLSERAKVAVSLVLIAGSLTGLGVLGGIAAPQYTVSQKGREFHPNTLTIRRGETIVIVNDDGDLRHHAYIDSSQFSFDSGDQEPGSRTPITIPVAGEFEVLCAIHPKMKLTLHVQ